MNWGKLGKVLGGAGLNVLAGAVPMGGIVKDIMANALGVDATPDAIESELTNNPDAIIKLRQVEKDHRLELEKIALATEQARLADIAGARARDVEFLKAGKRNWRADVLAASACIALIVLMWLIYNRAVPEGAQSAVMYILGTVQTIVVTVFNFEFGSSRGSKEKDSALANGGKK